MEPAARGSGAPNSVNPCARTRDERGKRDVSRVRDASILGSIAGANQGGKGNGMLNSNSIRRQRFYTSAWVETGRALSRRSHTQLTITSWVAGRLLSRHTKQHEY